jgi:hypothetical protein
VSESKFDTSGSVYREMQPETVRAFQRAADHLNVEDEDRVEAADRAWGEIEHLDHEDFPTHLRESWNKLKSRMMRDKQKEDLDEEARMARVRTADDVCNFVWELTPHNIDV